jgi:cytochrome c556
MIAAMSLRSLAIVLALTACGGGNQAAEPQTAREKQAKEAKDKDPDASQKSWGKWRYSGERASCFFQLKGKCFKTEKAACAAAACKAPAKCATTGAGPAMVSCS